MPQKVVNAKDTNYWNDIRSRLDNSYEVQKEMKPSFLNKVFFFIKVTTHVIAICSFIIYK